MARQSSINFKTSKSASTKVESAKDLTVTLAAFEEQLFVDHLQDYLYAMHAPTGRFDQHPVDDYHPYPTGMTEIDALMIVVNMQDSAMKDPALAAQVAPPADGIYTRVGSAWTEFENAAYINEMNIEARGVDSDKAPQKNLFGRMSCILNEKYGITRTGNACKNQWLRFLRFRSGTDERAGFRTSNKATELGENLRVSLNTKSPSKVTKTKGRSPSKKSKDVKGKKVMRALSLEDSDDE